LLLLGQNPELNVSEVESILRETATPTDARDSLYETAVADRLDLMPVGRDRDGHNAKHGYGRLSATNACIAASDPVALTLLRMGETAAARSYCRQRRRTLRAGYGAPLARWAVRRALCDSTTSHAIATLLRTFRLWSRHPDRVLEQPAGQILRQVALFVRLLAQGDAPEEQREELARLDVALRAALAGGRAGEIERALLAAVSAGTGWSQASSKRAVTQSGLMLVTEGAEALAKRRGLGSA
jgi:hypothetical protein